MNRKLYDALENCLQRMEQKESPDSILTDYPELTEQLRPLLETAIHARSARQGNPPSTILARQRSRGLILAADLRKKKGKVPFIRRFWRQAMTITSAIAILVMSGNGLLIASAHSLPGDTLYPLKRTVETTQLNFIHDPVKRQALQETFSEYRVDETRSLITIQRVEDVQFTGVLTSLSNGEWLISGIPVVVTSQTGMEGVIGIGENVEVEGSTNRDGRVEATRLLQVGNSSKNEGRPETPTQIHAEDGSGEASTDSAATPTYSGNYGHQDGSSSGQSTSISDENHSISEGTQVPQSTSTDGEGH